MNGGVANSGSTPSCAVESCAERYCRLPGQSSPGHELSHKSTSGRLYLTDFPIFKNFGPLRDTLHRRKLVTLMFNNSAT